MRKPGFTRVRLLAIHQTEIELATREAIPVGEKLNFTLHVKGVKNFVSAAGEVKKDSVRITVLKQPAFAVTVQIGKLSGDQTAKIAWAEEQLMPRQRTAPLRREEERPAGAAPAAAESACACGGDGRRGADGPGGNRPSTGRNGPGRQAAPSPCFS